MSTGLCKVKMWLVEIYDNIIHPYLTEQKLKYITALLMGNDGVKPYT